MQGTTAMVQITSRGHKETKDDPRKIEKKNNFLFGLFGCEYLGKQANLQWPGKKPPATCFFDRKKKKALAPLRFTDNAS
jgi:hypothetical protein